MFAFFGPFPVIAGSVAFVDIIPGSILPGSRFQGTNFPLNRRDPDRTASRSEAPDSGSGSDSRSATRDCAALQSRPLYDPDNQPTNDKTKYEVRSSFGVNPTARRGASDQQPRLRSARGHHRRRQSPSPYVTVTAQVSRLTDPRCVAVAGSPIVNVDVRDRRPGGSIDGTVIGSNGQPVASAKVVLKVQEISDTTGQSSRRTAVATSDGAGRFGFEYVQIRQGEVFQLYAADPATGFDSDAAGQITTEAQRLHLDVVLGTWRRRGKVLDELGAPVAGAFVSAESVFLKGRGNSDPSMPAQTGLSR